MEKAKDNNDKIAAKKCSVAIVHATLSARKVDTEIGISNYEEDMKRDSS